MKRYSQFLALLMVTSNAIIVADETMPGKAQKTPIALVGGTVHPINGPAIEDATIVFDAGKILAVGQTVEVPANAEVILVDGKHVYPGMFEAHSQLGLKEFDSIRASIDESEVGSVNPNAQAAVALNPDSSLLPVTRANGVLLALSAPTGGFISGQAAVIQLDGWTYEDLTLDADAAMVINWPSPPGRGRRGGRGAATPVPPTTDPLAELKTLLEEARRYRELRTHQADQQPIDLRLEALAKVAAKEIPVLAAADSLVQIEGAVAFAVRENLRLIILGGYDAAECADLLKRHEVPVVITAVHRIPQNRSDAYDASYTLPARLQAAGVRFCISSSGRSETWNSRNLPYHAATAVAYGLDMEQAMRSITLSPAEILGVSARVGSLEVGKDATLIVTDGNPLEIPTQTEIAFVQGRRVDLSNKHTRLRDKYLQKYDEKE
jgi:imidazolonepropionase-like amidohydrolase